MQLSRECILRPVATTLAMLALLLSGLIAWRLLPVSSLPEVDYPTIQVSTFYPGASPDVMASLVTSPLERQLGQMPGLRQMSSSSAAGASIVVLQFSLDLPLEVAEQQVQAAINAASNLLPRDLPAPPVYNKVNPADAPVMTLAVSAQGMPLHQLRDLVETRMAQRLSQIAGVGLVSVAGGQRPAVRIQADAKALAAHGLTLDDLRRAIVAANLNQPKGTLSGPLRSTTINANDQLRSPDEYGDLIIAYKDGAALRLADVAQAVMGAEDQFLGAWADREQAILLNIQRQPDSNVIQVVDRVKALLPKLQQAMPANVDVKVMADRTFTIRASVRDVQNEMLIAIGLVVLVTLAFLRTLTATFIPSVVVPLSLVGTFGVMYLLGFSINNLTLMSLTIATGFVVDDAIVMIENISRYLEKGESALQAAIKGASQIGFTLVSLTVSLIAVLIPLLFMQEVVGRLFREFAVTLAVAVLLSLLISLTLTPMMCARFLKPPKLRDLPGRQTLWTDWLVAAYDRALRVVLRHQTLTLLLALGTLVMTWVLYVWVPKGFFPQQDTGFVQVITEGPQNLAFPEMVKRQQVAVDRLLADPDVASVSSFVGIDGVNAALNVGRLQITLKPKENRRSRDLATVLGRLEVAVAEAGGLQYYFQAIQDLTVDDRVSRMQYQMTLESPDSSQLALWVPRLVDRLGESPAFAHVSDDLLNDGWHIELTIDRDTASRLGVTAAAIDEALYDAFGQRQISTIFTQASQYRVVIETTSGQRRDPQALDLIHVKTALGKPVPLTSVVSVTEGRSPLVLNRLNQFPVATVSFNLMPGTSLSEATKVIAAAERDIGMPAGVVTRFQGATEVFEASLSSTLWLILAAIVTMYIVLGILYESFIHPVTILSTLPSAAIGALAALLLTGRELDMIGVIGIILLIGLVKKNAIMMIDFALEAQRREQRSPEQAIHQAALLRFRPILMTTLAALFGALPLMLSTGTGAEMRQPLGLVLVGGLLVSQILTLFTTPVIYLFFDRLLSGKRSEADGREPA